MLYSDWWVTSLCEVVLVTHKDAKCIFVSSSAPPSLNQALKDHTNAVGDLEKTKYPHHIAQK
eukprot:1336933-Prymnesium_polylepis.1